MGWRCSYFIYSRSIWLDLRKCQNLGNSYCYCQSEKTKNIDVFRQEDEWMVKLLWYPNRSRLRTKLELFLPQIREGFTFTWNIKVGWLLKVYSCGSHMWSVLLLPIAFPDYELKMFLSFVLFCMMMWLTTSFAMPLFFSCRSYVLPILINFQCLGF
jgi:hypothetical protein